MRASPRTAVRAECMGIAGAAGSPAANMGRAGVPDREQGDAGAAVRWKVTFLHFLISAAPREGTDSRNMQTGSSHVLSACSGTGKPAKMELPGAERPTAPKPPSHCYRHQLTSNSLHGTRTKSQGNSGLPSDHFPGPSVMILTSFQLPTSCLIFETAILFFFLLEMFVLAQLNRTQWKFHTKLNSHFFRVPCPGLMNPPGTKFLLTKTPLNTKPPQNLT